MSFLSKATTGKRGRAQKVVIYGPEGIGKSTLAGRFPSPLFLDVEDSTSQLDVRRLTRGELPDLKAFESALAEIAGSGAKACATTVVDTIDWLEQMALDAVIADAKSDKITGIEDFGYGKGYTILRERMTILLAKLDAVITSGVTVVLLAHSKVVKFEPPDGAGPYDRYELKLSKQVAPLIKEWADMLLFGNWRTQVKERDKNESGAQFKGVGGKERLLFCNRTAAWDAKNRHALNDVEKWDIEVIAKAFRDVGAPWSEAKTLEAGAVTPATAGSGVAKSDVASEPKQEPVAKAAPSVVAETKAPVTPPPPPPAADGDQIPGLPVPAAKDAPADAELARICAPHGDAITAYLLTNKRINPGQTWIDMPADFAKRIKKNPAGFLKVAVRAEGVPA